MFSVCSSHFLRNVKFNLFQYGQAGNVTSAEYEGTWLTFDYVYLQWPNTVPPFKKIPMKNSSSGAIGLNL